MNANRSCWRGVRETRPVAFSARMRWTSAASAGSVLMRSRAMEEISLMTLLPASAPALSRVACGLQLRSGRSGRCLLRASSCTAPDVIDERVLGRDQLGLDPLKRRQSARVSGNGVRLPRDRRLPICCKAGPLFALLVPVGRDNLAALRGEPYAAVARGGGEIVVPGHAATFQFSGIGASKPISSFGVIPVFSKIATISCLLGHDLPFRTLFTCVPETPRIMP